MNDELAKRQEFWANKREQEFDSVRAEIARKRDEYKVRRKALLEQFPEEFRKPVESIANQLTSAELQSLPGDEDEQINDNLEYLIGELMPALRAYAEEFRETRNPQP